MRLSELQLTERATSVLFHYTSTNAALKILTSGNFELASTTGNKSEEQYAPKGRPFFLSLTRTPQGDYHRYVGTGAVLFKMDGDWFNSRYVVKPIDYWERAWLHSDGSRSREAEDRVFSAEPTIPTTSITEVHVLLKEQDEFRSPRTRMLMFVAKKQGLPVFLYTDEAAWRLLDKRKAKSVKDAGDVLRGAQVPSGPSRKPSDYVKPWIELITKNDQAHLSERAKRLLKTMRYYGRPDEDQNMSVDLSNARKPDAGDRASAVWLIKYMQDNGFKTTLELKNNIEDKWNKIIDAQQQQQKVTEEPIKLSGPSPAVKEFIAGVYERFPQTWQNNHVMPLGGEGDDQQFAMFELVPSMSKRGAAEVKWIQAYPLGQGVGGSAMKILQDMAREAGVGLTLYPWDKGVVSQSKLMKFYKKQGFQPTSKGAKNMQWDPAVNEVFDQPYDATWEKSESGSYDALVPLPDGTNLSIMFNNEGNDEWQIEFYRNNSQAVTGAGDVQRVFATVLNSIQKFVKEHKPWRLMFSASKDVDPGQNSESRAKLYNKLVQRYANAWGYEEYAEDHGDQVTYELTRKNTKIDELKIDNRTGKGAVPYNQDVDYFGLRVVMRPSTFLKLALPLPDDADYEHLKQHIAKGGAVGAPFLDVKIPPEWDDGDFSKPAKVVGHEGRHRMKAALSLEGDEPVETHIFPKGGYRARDLTHEFVKHLNQSLETQAGGRVLAGPLFDVGMNENFADGRHPKDKGDSKRLGVPTKASVSTLRKVAKQGGRKGQLAHWMANMKAGRAKHNK